MNSQSIVAGLRGNREVRVTAASLGHETIRNYTAIPRNAKPAHFRHCPAFLLKGEFRVLRVMGLLSVHLFGGEQEATQHLLAVFGVTAAGEAAQVAA